MLEIRNLSVSVQDKLILDNLSLGVSAIACATHFFCDEVWK